MNILPEIRTDQLAYFKSNVKEWLDTDEKIKALENQSIVAGQISFNIVERRRLRVY